ncbi:hypothetical protein Pmani_036706 [Petrolisthes manimaculis]|uniref:DNA mismatch repair protein MLH1 n=1 Tax=Petrolisthes manimaculis TaxID=1843537 RepID=A0AAE1NJX7_9EUCA|nr:hypothetical protein Pmani_036706 [Petrolisthes manimaculis]
MAPRIRKLDETVVNRIAAGEVVQRPANGLKEMIENCLDAKATQIQVTVKQGGMKLLQIQDNGTGILKEDLGLVCERFATSKLREFEDLASVATYGFRGEALASISHVAHLTLTTRTKDDKCAWKVSYCDGKMTGPPKPSAGNQGTQIAVEDLFYNVATRRRALKSPGEEHAKIAEVVGRYAVHNAQVGFTLKKQGDTSINIRTPPASTTLDNIRTIYGPSVAKELMEFACEDTKLRFKAEGYISNVNYSVKKCTFLLFINHRLVDCTALRKAIETIYASYLPKSCHPFLYLSLEMAPEQLDVNVHPTKHEVHFLHQDAVVEKIQQAVEAKLMGSNVSRTYYTQALLPGAATVPSTVTGCGEEESEGTAKSRTKGHGEKERVYAHQMVRTDSRDQKMDKFLARPGSSKSKETSSTNNEDEAACNNKVEEEENTNKLTTESNRREIKLTSVLTLRQHYEEGCHAGLLEAVRNLTFVGCVNPERALIQHANRLYLANTSSISEELFYQILLKDFGNFGLLKLSSAASIKELAMIALEQEASGWSEGDGSKEDLASYVATCLSSKAPMLDDYFSMQFDDDGNLCTLPYLLDDYVPSMEGLPMLVLRMATEVEWSNEDECFQTLCREMAKFFAVPREQMDEDKDEEDKEDKKGEEVKEKKNKGDGEDGLKWTIEHVVYPAVRKTLLPPQHFAQDTTFLQIANLTELYRVFERC